MSDIITVMLWPFLACLLLPWLLVYYGLHIVKREIIFVDLALAQVAAVGNCIAILMGYTNHDWQTYASAVGFTFVGSVIFTLTRTRSHRVPQEALIGIVYVVAAALGILLLSRSPEGNEELRRTLIGDVLLVTRAEVWKTLALFVVIGVLHYIFRRQFLAISFDPKGELAQSKRGPWWDFLFYVLFGFVVTSFLQIGGVLLVFTFLIMPSVAANMLSRSLPVQMGIAWLFATTGSVCGLVLSYKMDFPAGAAIVCMLGALLLVLGFTTWCARGRKIPQIAPIHAEKETLIDSN